MWKKLLDSPQNEVKHHSRYYLFSYLGRILSPFSLFLFSTFFECEMKISFINIVSELKNMESRMIAYKQEPKSRPCLLFLHLMTAIRKIIISTFFEYETDIPFISIYSESKIMEDTDQKIE